MSYKIYVMKKPVECETAAIATATQTDYDTVNKAMHRIRALPDIIENPIYGNPLSVYLTLIFLGYWKKTVTLTDLISGKGVPLQTIVLVKQGVTKQHWVLFAGKVNKNYYFYWGYHEKLVKIDESTLIKLYTTDGPVNDAFMIYKANIFDYIYSKINMYINMKWIKIKSLFG